MKKKVCLRGHKRYFLSVYISLADVLKAFSMGEGVTGDTDKRNAYCGKVPVTDEAHRSKSESVRVSLIRLLAPPAALLASTFSQRRRLSDAELDGEQSEKSIHAIVKDFQNIRSLQE